MKMWMMALVGALMLALSVPAAETAPGVKSNTGLQTAATICKITGVAMSPLLGTGAVGAYEWWQTPSEKRAQLSWYAHPLFWAPALLLVGAVAAKDAAGAALPPGWKKPFDVAETVENKVSGVVAAGAFVPLIATFFPTGGGGSASLVHLGFATVSFGGFLNLLLTPLAMAAFVLVWIACHGINVLILISPWGAVDASLKAFRVFLMGLVTVTSFTNPMAGAILSIIIIIIAYFLAGWSFRLSVFGSVFVWDFITGKRKRFQPAPNANWMFTSRRIEKTPIRTYGKLVKTADGKLTLEYRPWLILKARTLTLPAGRYAVGRGLFYPEIMALEGEKETTTLLLPPRYRTHEEEVSRAYGFGEVRDVGLLKGFKVIWRWVRSGFRPQPAAAAAG
jgi:hypothetical protein